jgi:peptide/nickel transport system substrate-binding protein/oligopeptide transport system substrate-binding protein
MTLVLAGCQSTTLKKQVEITVGLENDLNNLDPIKCKDVYRIQVIGQIFEGLVGIDGKNQVIPMLAQSWSHNKNFTVWNFKLRKGVYFHENPCFGEKRTREVTAQDVKYSLERVLGKDAYPAFVLADAIAGVADFQTGKAPHVSGIEVLSPEEVQITLNAPESFFLGKLTSDWIVVVPREAVEQADKSKVFGVDTLVGTGPYQFASGKDTEVVLDRFGRYWRTTQGNVERVTFKVIKNEQIRYSELRNGRLSIMRVPLTMMPAVADNANGKVTIKDSLANSLKLDCFPTFNTYMFGFNCDKVDANLRKAASFAVNRKEILDVTTHGAGRMAPGPLPINQLGYQPAYKGDLFDLAKAKAALAKVPPGNARKMEIMVSELDNSEPLGQLIQNQLKNAGIEASLKKVDFNSLLDSMVKGQCPAYITHFEWVYSAPEPILITMFGSGKVPVPNFWHYRNPLVDTDLRKLGTMSERSELNKLDAKIEKQIIDDAPVVFLYQLDNPFLFQRSITNLQLNGHNVPLLWEVKVGQPAAKNI